MHIAEHPDHTIAWGNTTFLDSDRNFNARRMKESLYIDIFSGTMKLEEGMFKILLLEYQYADTLAVKT